MKYTNYSAFEKHLADAGHAHLSPVYLVSCNFEPDRKILLDRMVRKFPKNAEVMRFPLARFSEDLLPHIREMSLFGLERLFIVQEAEIQAEALLHFLQKPLPKTYLLLGLPGGKEPKAVQEMAKLGAVWLDLSREKPWEREKRLMLSLREQAFQAGKNMAPDLIERLIHLIGSDWQKLEREIEKLVAFVGPRHEITASDIDSTVAGLKELSSWQISEEIAWGQKSLPIIPTLDTSEFLALIGALRYQIQLGWQMASMPLEALPQHFKSYQVQKYGKLAHAKSMHYFQRALIELYEMETLAKSTSLDPRLLITRFVGRLREAMNQ